MKMLPIYTYRGQAHVDTDAATIVIPVEFSLHLFAETNQETFDMAMKALGKVCFDSNFNRLYNAMNEARMENDRVLGDDSDDSGFGYHEGNGSEPSA